MHPPVVQHLRHMSRAAGLFHKAQEQVVVLATFESNAKTTNLAHQFRCYHAEVGMPEARRTVVSNIHKDGVPAVEAGAYIVDLLALILEKQASGVDLKK